MAIPDDKLHNHHRDFYYHSSSDAFPTQKIRQTLPSDSHWLFFVSYFLLETFGFFFLNCEIRT